MYSEACGRFSALKPWCGVRRLTRSWCSWSGPGDRGRSERSVAALRWWNGTSGRCTCPGLWLFRGYSTAGTGAWGKWGRDVKRDRCSFNNCFDTLHHSGFVRMQKQSSQQLDVCNHLFYRLSLSYDCNQMGRLPASILDKAHICKHSLANVTAEAVGVPTIVHGLDDTTNDELSWGKPYVRDQPESILRLTFNICWA